MNVFAGAITSSPVPIPIAFESELQRRGSGGDADAIAAAAVRGPLLLEPRDLLAEDVLRRCDRLDQRLSRSPP